MTKRIFLILMLLVSISNAQTIIRGDSLTVNGKMILLDSLRAESKVLVKDSLITKSDVIIEDTLTVEAGGSISTPSFKLTTSPVNNSVLKSDANGNASWVAAAPVADGASWTGHTMDFDDFFDGVVKYVGLGMEYTTLQSAIDAFGTMQADSQGTIVVLAYTVTDEFIELKNHVNIIGTSSSSILNSTVHANGDTCTLSNLVFELTTNDSLFYATGSNQITFDNCKVRHSVDTWNSVSFYSYAFNFSDIRFRNSDILYNSGTNVFYDSTKFSFEGGLYYQHSTRFYDYSEGSIENTTWETDSTRSKFLLLGFANPLANIVYGTPTSYVTTISQAYLDSNDVQKPVLHIRNVDGRHAVGDMTAYRESEVYIFNSDFTGDIRNGWYGSWFSITDSAKLYGDGFDFTRVGTPSSGAYMCTIELYNFNSIYDMDDGAQSGSHNFELSYDRNTRTFPTVILSNGYVSFMGDSGVVKNKGNPLAFYDCNANVSDCKFVRYTSSWEAGNDGGFPVGDPAYPTLFGMGEGKVVFTNCTFENVGTDNGVVTGIGYDTAHDAYHRGIAHLELHNCVVKGDKVYYGLCVTANEYDTLDVNLGDGLDYSKLVVNNLSFSGFDTLTSLVELFPNDHTITINPSAYPTWAKSNVWNYYRMLTDFNSAGTYDYRQTNITTNQHILGDIKTLGEISSYRNSNWANFRNDFYLGEKTNYFDGLTAFGVRSPQSDDENDSFENVRVPLHLSMPSNWFKGKGTIDVAMPTEYYANGYCYGDSAEFDLFEYLAISYQMSDSTWRTLRQTTNVDEDTCVVHSQTAITALDTISGVEFYFCVPKSPRSYSMIKLEDADTIFVTFEPATILSGTGANAYAEIMINVGDETSGTNYGSLYKWKTGYTYKVSDTNLSYNNIDTLIASSASPGYALDFSDLEVIETSGSLYQVILTIPGGGKTNEAFWLEFLNNTYFKDVHVSKYRNWWN